MHLAPLTGIETIHANSSLCKNRDASRAPYGDWNLQVQPPTFVNCRCISRPLRGLKLCFGGEKYMADRCISRPLRGLKHLSEYTNSPQAIRCISRPLRGLKPILCTTTFNCFWCISRPLRGLKPCCNLNISLTDLDASRAPYGDWNIVYIVSFCHLDIWCISRPLRGLKRSGHKHTKSEITDASRAPYGDWNWT